MIFKHFDYLANTYGFSFDGSIRYQTNCGGFLSLILALVALVTAGSMGATFFNRTSPSVYNDYDKYYSPPPVNFDSSFNVAFRMTVGAEHLYAKLDQIKIKLYQVIIYDSNFSNTTTVEVPMSPCDRTKFPLQEAYFDQFMLNESLCPVMAGKSIEGAFLSEYFVYYQAKFILCINDPVTGTSTDGDGTVCQNQTEIYNFLEHNSVRAHIFYADTDYNLSNYSDPQIYYMNNYNIDLFFNTQRETHLYFQYNNLTSDDTYFFLAPSSRSFSQVAFNYFAERPAYRETYNNNLCLMNIRTDKNLYYSSRSYTLFSQTIANIGAILNICLLFFKVVIFAISRMQFFIRLLKNSVYLYYNNPNLMLKLNSDKIDVEKEKKKKIDNQLGKNLEESKVNIINTHIEINDLKEGTLTKVIPKLELLNLHKKKTDTDDNKNLAVTKVNLAGGGNDNKSKFESFNITKYENDNNFLELYVLALCPCVKYCNKRTNDNLTMIDYSKKHYYRYTDFFRFLDKFIELNIIKKLLLKKDEAEMVDIMKKIVLIKKFDVLDIVRPDKEAPQSYSTTLNHINERVKKKGSLPVLEERLKKFLSKAQEKENKSIVEMNILDQFDDILKG